MIDYRLLGSRLKAQRESLHLTQEQVAEKADITVVYLSKSENGKVHTTLDTLNTLCAALEYDLGHLFAAVTTESNQYQNERVHQLFHACSPAVKPIALKVLEDLSQIQ